MHQVWIIRTGAIMAAVARELRFDDPISLHTYVDIVTVMRFRGGIRSPEKSDFAFTAIALNLCQGVAKLGLANVYSVL